MITIYSKEGLRHLLNINNILEILKLESYECLHCGRDAIKGRNCHNCGAEDHYEFY